MQKLKPIIVISILLLSTLACNALIPLPDANNESLQNNQPSSDRELPITEAEVPRVSVGDAKAAFEGGKAIIVDVRSQAAYEAGHVAGALSIPLNEFETNIASVDLPKDKWIIAYCT
jgi:3-mercaptopyruvate sulfurtransferase SseA